MKLIIRKFSPSDVGTYHCVRYVARPSRVSQLGQRQIFLNFIKFFYYFSLETQPPPLPRLRFVILAAQTLSGELKEHFDSMVSDIYCRRMNIYAATFYSELDNLGGVTKAPRISRNSQGLWRKNVVFSPKVNFHNQKPRLDDHQSFAKTLKHLLTKPNDFESKIYETFSSHRQVCQLSASCLSLPVRPFELADSAVFVRAFSFSFPIPLT